MWTGFGWTTAPTVLPLWRTEVFTLSSTFWLPSFVSAKEEKTRGEIKTWKLGGPWKNYSAEEEEEMQEGESSHFKGTQTRSYCKFWWEVPSSGKGPLGLGATHIYLLCITLHQTGPVDVPMFFRAALENKLPVIEKYLLDKGDPNVCDEVHSSLLTSHLLHKRDYYRTKTPFTTRFCSFHTYEEKKTVGEK